ncbi:MAG: ankyrin repeat domain-containing protein, partial [Coxiellaceae bacterium]|nr:ankyrin repeat domain-containing protein [Coxiellaceae bacterium]
MDIKNLASEIRRLLSHDDHFRLIADLINQQTLMTKTQMGKFQDPATKRTLLHDAVLKHHIGLVKLLLETSPESVNIVDNDGNTPLALAVINNHTKVATLLLQHGANSASIDANNRTLLHHVNPHNTQMISLLLQYNSPFFFFFLKLKSVLWSFTNRDYAWRLDSLIPLFLEHLSKRILHKHNPETTVVDDLIDEKIDKLITLLCACQTLAQVLKGLQIHSEMLKDKRPTVGHVARAAIADRLSLFRIKFGQTPLHVAVGFVDIETCDAIINLGCSLHDTDSDHRSLLHSICSRVSSLSERKAWIEWYVEKDGDISVK